MRKISLVILAIASYLPTIAQEDTTQTKELGEVVITGQYKPQSVKNSVYQVRVISKERIQRQGAAKLQDVLNNELNIRFSQDVATGGSDITMMGLKGQNVKILVDGMPMVGRQGTSNEININQIDINSIERIEIVEGPMSVIYGADALAGVINIITKKAGAPKFSVTARLHEESIGKEYGIQQGIHNQYAGLTYRHKQWDIGGAIGRNYFGGWKDTAINRELVWHKKDQLIANAFLGYTKGKFSIRYRFDGLDEIITNPGNFISLYPAAADTLANDQEYLTNRLMQQLQASYFVNNDLSFQAQASYSDYSRQVYSTNVSKKTGAVTQSLAPGSQAIDEFNGFTFRGTANYRLTPTVSFQPGVDINLESGKGARLKDGSNEVNDYAFFITSEIILNKLSIRPGLRFINNSVYDAPPVIPSINAKWILGKQLDWRFSYARGFRSPSLRELYFNFFDANHQIVGNPDLEAETSHSFNTSFTWKKVTPSKVVYTTVLGGFYNDIKNLIDYAVSASDPNVFMLTNVSSSKTAGFNLSTVIKYQQWNLSLGGSYTGFYNDYSEEEKSLPVLQWSPEANAVLGYNFKKCGLDLNLFYKFTGKRPSYIYDTNQEYLLTEIEGFHMADLTLNKKMGKLLTLNAGVRNLFDVSRINSSVAGGGVHSSNGLRSIANGRSFFGGLLFNFEKTK